MKLVIWLALSACFYSTLGYSAALVIASDDAPPHMIAKSNSGIDLDIVTQVLKKLEHSVTYTYAPLHRAKQMVIDGKADVVVPTFYQEDNDKLCISDPIIKYKPTIFTRLADGFSLNKLSDIANLAQPLLLTKNRQQLPNSNYAKSSNAQSPNAESSYAPNTNSKNTNANHNNAEQKLSIVSFQGATGYFGKDFQNAVANADYRELHDMSKLPAMLITGRADIVVLDYYIFYYYLKQAAKQDDNIRRSAGLNKIQDHFLIPEVNAYVGFRDAVLRDEFNQALSVFVANKHHEVIVEKYLYSSTD